MTSKDKVETHETHTYIFNSDYTTDKDMEKEIHNQMLLENTYGNKDIQRSNKGNGDNRMDNNNKIYQSSLKNCSKIVPTNKRK